jgi:opacity protein-like surface antigen
MMNRLIAAGALVALSFSAANAADIDDRTSRLDPPNYGNPTDVEEYKTPFIGFGIGLQGSIEHDTLQLNGKDGSFFRGLSSDGFNLGGEIDYLNGYGNGRIGGYCNGGWSNVDTELDIVAIPGDLEVFRKEHQFGCGLKGGLVVTDSTFLYGKFGYEWQKWSAFNELGDANAQAWVFGGGAETLLRQDVSLDVGVDYLRLHDADDELGAVFEDSDSVRGVITLRYRP